MLFGLLTTGGKIFVWNETIHTAVYFCKYDSAPFISHAQFCSDHFITIWKKEKWKSSIVSELSWKNC